MFNRLFFITLFIETIICCDYRQYSIRNPKFRTIKRSIMEHGARSVTTRLEEYGIVPDVIDSVEKLEVKFPSGAEVNLGNELTPFQVKDEPTVSWTAQDDQYYSLAMLDPDVPSRKVPTGGPVKHWLVVNIPGNNLTAGQTLAPFVGSQPAAGSGIHRYTFLVFRQTAFLNHSEKIVDPNSSDGRFRFHVRDFARKYDLGHPIAANFYQAINDEYAKSLWAQRLQNDETTTWIIEFGIVPDIIDVSPKRKIQIRYPSGVSVNFGNELTPFDVKDQPIVDWATENGANYTLIMTDPDVPNFKNPSLGQVKHWLVINIPGTNVTAGQTLASYRGSAPPEGSGFHRYTFLVYKQPGYLVHSENHTIPIGPENRKERINFKVRDFVKKYNLGDPVAGNFYVAQSDNYTKQLWAKWNSQQN